MDLPQEIFEQIVNNLPDREIIKYVVLHRFVKVFKPTLHNFYFYQQLEQIEDKIQEYWQLETPASITDLFILSGVVYEDNLPDKYKNNLIPLVVDLDNPPDVTNPLISRYVSINNHKTDVMIHGLKYHQRPSNFKSILQLQNLRSVGMIYDSFLISDIQILKELENLRSLEITNNHLKILPESIGEIKTLTKLNLDDNNLKFLPNSIANLTNLRVSNNELTELPTFNNLISLSASKNELIDFPNLPNTIVELVLTSNKIQSIPESIGNLVNLTTLFLNKNQLEILPESVGQLTNLNILSLEHNRLKSLPESIGNLQKLSLLYINGNQISDFPDSMIYLYRLRKIYMDINRLTPRSMDVLKQIRINNPNLKINR